MKNIPSDRSVGLLIALALSPIFFVFLYFNQPERGALVGTLVGVFVAICYVKKDEIRERYFVWTMSILLLVEVSLVVLVEFRNSIPQFVLFFSLLRPSMG